MTIDRRTIQIVPIFNQSKLQSAEPYQMKTKKLLLLFACAFCTTLVNAKDAKNDADIPPPCEKPDYKGVTPAESKAKGKAYADCLKQRSEAIKAQANKAKDEKAKQRQEQQRQSREQQDAKKKERQEQLRQTKEQEEAKKKERQEQLRQDREREEAKKKEREEQLRQAREQEEAKKKERQKQ